jgi:hypothetical protein
MKAILQQLGGPIRVWGYRGAGQNFRRIVGDVVFAINFQKSGSGDRFFVNLGGQPTAIPDASDGEPKPKTLKEYDCVFRFRLHGDWSTALDRVDVARLIAAVDDARRSFESKVLAMRDLSRRGRGEDLLDD